MFCGNFGGSGSWIILIIIILLLAGTANNANGGCECAERCNNNCGC